MKPAERVAPSQQLRDAIEDKHLRAVASRWWECRAGQPVPQWRHMPHDAFAPLMPAVLLYRHAPAERSFRVEPLRADLTGLTRLPVGGKLIDEFLPPDMLESVRARLMTVIERPAVVLVRVGDRANPARGVIEERLMLPMRSGRKIDLILAAYSRLDPSALGWLPITQNEISVVEMPVATLA
jgi:hypothetical protein